MSATLTMRDVVAEYSPGQPILRGLTLAAEPGHLSVIIGPNGSGKSTALRVLAGLLIPTSGTVSLRTDSDELDVSHVPAHERAGRGIGFLPQGHSVFPAMSVHDNLLLGGWSVRRSRKISDAVASAYARYPALADKRNAPAGSLSGGQQRILELARSLIADPSILLVDEPSAGVAPVVATLMYQELAQLRDEGRTVILVDQDVRAALAVADTVYVLKSGAVDRWGPTADFGDDLDALVRDWLALDPAADTPHASIPQADTPQANYAEEAHS
ncbi:MAG: ATP-binding cassette domain-containing protein [Mycobacterium sp.]